MKLHIVSATRSSKPEFWNHGALGISLRRLAHDRRLVPWIAYDNRTGLPQIYNQAIGESTRGDALVFIHDDVWIDDLFFSDAILRGLDCYDLIGIAGNRRRLPRQPGWAFSDERFVWDDQCNLSGSIAHGQVAFGRPTVYGPTPAPCKLLDGVMLAARSDTLAEHGCRFDPRFEFHFYDLDICRSADAAGMTLGTWPVSLTHQSGGAFGTKSWWRAYHQYLAKWEPAQSANPPVAQAVDQAAPMPGVSVR